MRVAEGLIATGQARRALVVTGETPTLAANYAIRSMREFRDAFIGFTVGDAGGAVAMEPSDDERGIFYRHVWSASQHWDVTGVPGGGSRHPRGDEFLYARGDGGQLRDIVRAFDVELSLRAFAATGTTVDDYALFVIHQVTGPFTDEMIGRLGFPPERVARTIEQHGNIAAATFPVALDEARIAGRIRRGDRVLFVGLGAGISVATLGLTL
jgi:3-oxoacyl-[acyl-carrier-protein] synthase-3